MPQILIDTLVAAEDQRFYQHNGVDWRALVRVMRDRLQGKRDAGGGSTIEQQLIKISYFPAAKRTVLQKLREITAAQYWSLTHDKDQTLETYLNTAYFGNHAYGISAATQIYFHKNVQDITAEECALLVGILPAPSQYDPHRQWTKAQTRMNYVLDRLVATNKITADQRKQLSPDAIELFTYRAKISSPHFVFAVLDELEQQYPDIESGGYTIRTTLDPALQHQAEQVVARRIDALEKQHATNGALIALDPKSGDVLAYVGSRSFFNDKIDGAVDMVQAKRQPGSSLKPFMYLRAFTQGFTPATIIADIPVRFTTAEDRSYYPRNYSFRYYGPVSVRDALGSSLNIPAVRVLDKIGLAEFFSTMHRFGVDFPEPPDHYGLSVVLGGGEVTLHDVGRAYAELALYGRGVETKNVLEIRDHNGRIIYQASDSNHEDLFDQQQPAITQSAALIADILSDKTARSRAFGEANLLNVDDKRIAVKTGTTKDFRDNWAFGYTPDFVLGVWVGNADNSPMQGVSGVSGAVPIWHDIMQYKYERSGAINWPEPEGIIKKQICVTSGLLATPACNKTRLEKFIAGTEPTQTDTWYQTIDIDATTGFIATDACRNNIVQKTYLMPPPEYSAWLTASGQQRPPEQDCTGKLVKEPAPLQILSPIEGDIFEIDPHIDKQSQRIPFVVGGYQQRYIWQLNGKPIETPDPVYFWDPQPGSYTLTLQNTQIHFTVR